MNTGVVSGSVVQDAEQTIAGTTPITRFCLMVKEFSRSKNLEEALFFNVDWWGDHAKHVWMLKRGREIILRYRLDRKHWHDEAGISQDEYRLVAEEILPIGE